MTEGAAILLHIADSHPESKLAPLPGSSERAQHEENQEHLVTILQADNILLKTRQHGSIVTDLLRTQSCRLRLSHLYR